ncbi:putative HTH-type transcriptional regulator YxaF [Clostridium puniceum]|uniref:Putative HTH-type transcriptional regulator YxaF n=1 Tax=Clostridium puniceum TaxID=29367 RepID=A0A1S8TCT9_9CLOT|nr:TetR/AcrR family transcriptional regulator [Clostridium puniceum]OOM75610.1 putative HTH-type transcriptional regulator YxaF [Clostridium puniceum]
MGNNTNAKEKFIETAYKLFEVKGYNGTGLNEILKESGAPKGSLYYHFPNGKEELALESIKLAGEKIIANLKRTLDKFNNPIDGIVSNINNIAEIIDKNKKMHDMSISLIALETYDCSEILRMACEKVFEEIEDLHFEKLIEYGFNKNKAKELAVSISAMTEGAILLSLTRQNGEALRQAGKQVKVLINI